MILTPIASTTSVLFKCYERADIISILILPSTNDTSPVRLKKSMNVAYKSGTKQFHSVTFKD